MRERIVFAGLDVHLDSITLAVFVEDSPTPEWIKTIPNDLVKLLRIMKRLSKLGTVRACYEASGAGYVLHRALSERGVHCDVIAPSLIPVRSGDRRKTDRRDAEKLARLYRAGELTAIHIPSESEEAVRDLTRCREAFRRDILRSRQRITKLLRRRGLVFRSGSKWTLRHRKWLRSLDLGGVEQSVFEEYLSHLDYLLNRSASLDKQIEEAAFSDFYRERVEVLCAFKGIKEHSAMVLLSELGDVSRFATPRELMCYLGLTPSEYSSGGKERRGPITKAGNSHCRHVLIQAAWCYRLKPQLGPRLAKKHKNLPPEIAAMSWKAQHRLNKRYWRLEQRKSSQVAVVAVARELVGFLWAALASNGRETAPKQTDNPLASRLGPPIRTIVIERFPSLEEALA